MGINAGGNREHSAKEAAMALAGDAPSKPVCDTGHMDTKAALTTFQ